MASDHPLEGLLAHLILPIHLPGSNSMQQQQQRQPDCRLHLVLPNFVHGLHKPLRSFARCFGNDSKRAKTRPGGKQLPPLRDTSAGASPRKKQQPEILLCIAFDALAHNLQMLEDACKQKGKEFGSSSLQIDQFQELFPTMVRSLVSTGSFPTRVGAPPASLVDDSPASAQPAVCKDRTASVIGDREGIDSEPQQPPRWWWD